MTLETITKAPFRFDQVGSLLRPKAIKEARADFAAGSITKEELTKIENKEIRRIVGIQKEIGLHAITDGEFRRRWWHLDFLENLNGITKYSFYSKAFGFEEEQEVQGSFISERISFNPDHPFLEHFKFLKAEVGDDALAKQTIPGPGMIYLDDHVISKKYRENSVYENEAELRKDLVQTYQDAILVFYDAGCRYLQIDDTSSGGFFDERFRGIITSLGFNPDELIENLADITEEILTVKPADLNLTYHFCRGNFQSHHLYSGSYEKIAKRLFKITAIDGFFLEFDDQRSGNFSPLQEISTQKVVLGLITTKTPELESKEEVKVRIKEASKYVPLNQLCLGPQCGFASTEEGNYLTEEQQWEKLKLVKEIALEVWPDAE